MTPDEALTRQRGKTKESMASSSDVGSVFQCLDVRRDGAFARGYVMGDGGWSLQKWSSGRSRPRE